LFFSVGIYILHDGFVCLSAARAPNTQQHAKEESGNGGRRKNKKKKEEKWLHQKVAASVTPLRGTGCP
jgi:hypothetical protein